MSPWCAAPGCTSQAGADSAVLKIVGHSAVIIGLYLAFSFALFLGLQIDPTYGNIGLLAVAVLAGCYAYLGFFRK